MLPLSLDPASVRSSSLYHAFCRTADAMPDAVAWIAADTASTDSGTRMTWTWKDLQTRVQCLAAWLEANSIGLEERVVNLAPNSVDWVVLDLACAAIGAIHVPIDRRLPTHQIRELLLSIDPSLLLFDRSKPPGGKGWQTIDSHPICELRDAATPSVLPSPRQLARWLEPIDGHATACILATSGTTGPPKGVMLSHTNLLRNAAAKQEAMPQSGNDIRLNLLPFAHAYAKTCELGIWILVGGTMVCANGIQDALAMAPAIQPTLLNGVPAFYESFFPIWQNTGRDTLGLKKLLGPKIRRLASGGAPLPEAIRSAFALAELPLFQGYGLTEASPVVCSNRAATESHHDLLEGVGPPVRETEVRVDADGRLWVRGPGVMQGYWRDPAATERKLRDGWLDTGDCIESVPSLRHSSIAYPDPTSITIAGRCDDVQVLSNGFKFSPRPLERAIERLAPVQHCVFVGNKRRTPLMIVQLRSGYRSMTAQELLSMAREELRLHPWFCLPTQVVMDDSPWTTDSGLVHWKGNLHRRAIEARFASLRDSS
jgi:long-chain acyl-CoA synthetase